MRAICAERGMAKSVFFCRFVVWRSDTDNCALDSPLRMVDYRLANEDDITGISMVFAEAYDDLHRKRGLFEAPMNPVPPSPIFAFLIRKTPDAFWVAEDEGRIVGFSDSFVRGSLWYFSWLFVSPSHQGRDIGKSLLERTLTSWKDSEITNRATITFAINPSSQSLYMRYGMYPREPVYYVHGSAETIKREKQSTELDFMEVKGLSDGSAFLKQMDQAALGFSLGWHHEYFFETKATCYAFKDRGQPVGYAYVRPSGGVGPMAVNSSRFTEPALETALRLSASQAVDRVGYWTPGSNTRAVETALKYKMRFDPYVFMSTKPFAKWENYLFNSAALM
jgi:GNAT superfamily N-acetyltransferase